MEIACDFSGNSSIASLVGVPVAGIGSDCGRGNFVDPADDVDVGAAGLVLFQGRLSAAGEGAGAAEPGDGMEGRPGIWMRALQ